MAALKYGAVDCSVLSMSRPQGWRAITRTACEDDIPVVPSCSYVEVVAIKYVCAVCRVVA